MEQIGQIIGMTTQGPSGAAKKPEPVELCEVCGKPTKLKMCLLDREVIVNCFCACIEEKRRREEEARQKAEAEWERRRNKRYSLMDEKARAATFEKLKIDDDNRRIASAAENYCRQWEQNRRDNNGLLFYGKPGRGKTTIACCIANRLLDMGVSVKAMSVNDMIQRVKDSFDKNGQDGETELKREIKNADMLILDDLGAEYKTDWSAALVYEIIDARYRSQKPTIVTTNLTMFALCEHLTDNNGVSRAYDRLIEILSPVEFKGKNYRQDLSTSKNYNFFKGAKQ